MIEKNTKRIENNLVVKLRNWLKRIPILNKALGFLYRKIKPDKSSVIYWIRKFISNREIQVLQIGSNDGISGDTLHKLIKENKQWQVLFVEPVPNLFEKLKRNYGSNKRFKFENAGINEDGNPQKFYKIGEEAFKEIPALSENYKQIGSFSREHVEKLSTPEITKFIEEVDVNCMSLEKLLEKHKIETLDLVQIDAEGYDWKILSQLDLGKYKPEMIIFESKNLEEKEKEDSIKSMRETYYMFSMRQDFMCIRKDKLKRRYMGVLSSRLAN